MSFQDELNKASRTPEDVATTEYNENFTDGIYSAELDYPDIKEQLLKMANNGEYQMVNGKRRILFYYKNNSIQNDFLLKQTVTHLNKTLFNPKGSRADKVYYTLINRPHYEGYMKKLKELAEPDNIKVRTVGLYNYHNEKIQAFDVSNSFCGFLLLEMYLSLCVECIVEY